MEDGDSIDDHNVNAMMNGMDIGNTSTQQDTISNHSTSQINEDSTQANNNSKYSCNIARQD